MSDNQNVQSDPRIRSFFGFDPLVMIDDIICATSHYINNGIDSLYSLLSQYNLSDERKTEITRKLAYKLNESFNKNSDMFEMYCMRNIFPIHVDIDLCDALINSEKSAPASPYRNQIGPDEDIDEVSETLDQQLLEIQKNIEDQKTIYYDLVQSIRSKKVQLCVSQKLLERKPRIEHLINKYKQIPAEKIANITQQMTACLEMVEKYANILAEEEQHKRLSYHKNTFKFD